MKRTLFGLVVLLSTSYQNEWSKSQTCFDFYYKSINEKLNILDFIFYNNEKKLKCNTQVLKLFSSFVAMWSLSEEVSIKL